MLASNCGTMSPNDNDGRELDTPSSIFAVQDRGRRDMRVLGSAKVNLGWSG